MKYGQELIDALEGGIVSLQNAIKDRMDRISNGMTDIDDCFISQRCEERGISNNRDKIALIKNGGCEWFVEYATLDGRLVDAKWCNTQYGHSLRVVMPDGKVVWTTASTKKGLAKRGLKKVLCLRPAWFRFQGSGGMLGVYTGNYVTFPSSFNYATGEPAGEGPVAIKDYEEVSK